MWCSVVWCRIRAECCGVISCIAFSNLSSFCLLFHICFFLFVCRFSSSSLHLTFLSLLLYPYLFLPFPLVLHYCNTDRVLSLCGVSVFAWHREMKKPKKRIRHINYENYTAIRGTYVTLSYGTIRHDLIKYS